MGQRVALYCRVSTADQSCARQERDLTAAAERSSYEVVGTFKETGSGVKPDRAERRKVMALAQRRHIDEILVTELSGCGRSTTALLATLKEMEARRVSVIALNGMAFDLSTPHGRMIATVMASISEFERELIQEGIHSGIAAAQARGKKLDRQPPGQRPKSDRLAPKVLALVAQDRSYRLIGREVGLSKNTVAGIIKRGRAVPLAALLYFACNSVWAQGIAPFEPQLEHAADVSSRTVRACKNIGALADRGAAALRTIDLLRRNAPIDLNNDGDPVVVHRTQDGSAATSVLVDEAYRPLKRPGRDDYFEAVRWADESAILRVEGRTWGVDYYTGSVDDTAVLAGATDGTAACRFRTTWQAPTFRLLPEGERRRMHTYRALLFGQQAVPPPTADINLEVVRKASDFLGLPSPVSVEAPSWRADLLNNGQQLTLVRVHVNSGGGPGCDYNMVGLVQYGRVAGAGLVRPLLPGRNTIAPVSRELDRVLGRVVCSGVAETPVLGDDQRTYVLADNIAAAPNTANRIRLLASVRGARMRALARLSWKVRNEVLAPDQP